jgi:Predicted transcriptional regulators
MELKVNEVASELNETAHVIRNWTRYFKQYLSLIKGEKNNYNLYPPEAMEVLRTIQRLHRQQGYSTRQIKNYLSGGGTGSRRRTGCEFADCAGRGCGAEGPYRAAA